jgi:hypothetical protein
VLGYGVDKHGYVRGIHKLKVALDAPGSFLLGPRFRKHAAISQHCDASELGSFATIIDADLERLSERELINFARQDGATVIDRHGKFRGCMVLLRPAANTEAEVGLGKGARHSSAAKISAEAQCLTVVVSQDGPITVYKRGQRVLSL